jgi:2-octaprenyl-6-methoxyphenol hydroxylase|tara:strand:+ start:871 stop:2013 length:1143 start_codon:yes stop_codon:yes gene_type:complete
MQKICIIGDGLTSLSAAVILSQENIKIDLYAGNNLKKKNDNRTTAVSESSFQFIRKKFNIKKKNIFWPCKEIKLFYEDGKFINNFLNFKESNKNFMYIFKNKELKQILHKQIKKKENIKLIKKNITNIDYTDGSIFLSKKKIFYDLIILSIGSKSKLYDNITHGRLIEKNYKEMAITTTIKHNHRINNAAQFFLKEGPFAILPFNKNTFSIVWSVGNIFFEKNKKYLKKILKEKIKILLNNIDFKIKNISNIESFPIKLNLKKIYFNKNVLILGDGLHTVHPMAGQGFNLVLRDIKKLSDLMYNALKLGLSLKNSFVLENFYKGRKPENTILGLGIDLTNIFFKNNKLFFPIKKIILSNINKLKFIKKLSQKISDKGITT